MRSIFGVCAAWRGVLPPSAGCGSSAHPSGMMIAYFIGFSFLVLVGQDSGPDHDRWPVHLWGDYTGSPAALAKGRAFFLLALALAPRDHGALARGVVIPTPKESPPCDRSCC